MKKKVLLTLAVFLVNSILIAQPLEKLDHWAASKTENFDANDVVNFLNGNRSAGDITFGTEEIFNTTSTQVISATTLDATHFVVAYQDAGNGNKVTAIVGTVSGSTIGFGAEYVFPATTTTNDYISATTLDATHFVVAYRNFSNDSHGTAIVGTVNVNEIVYGTPVEFNEAFTSSCSATTLDATHFVVAYGNGNYSTNSGTAIVGTVSGSAISYGTAVVFNSATTTYCSTSTLDATHIVVAFRDVGNSGKGTAIVITVTGSAIAYGSEYEFNSGSTNYCSITTLDATHFIVAYQDAGNGSYGTARAGTVSGSTISYDGSEYVFNSAYTPHLSTTTLDATHFVVAYVNDNSSYYGNAIVGTVSGSAIAYGSEYEFNSGSTEYISATTLDATHFVVAYKDVGNSNQGTARVGEYESDIINWDGSTDTDWNDGTNWDGGSVPTSEYHVVIPDVTNDPIIANYSPASPAVCNNLTLQSDASLVINAGNALTVSGDLNVASSKGAASMTINSNASSTGSLLVEGSATGSVTIQRYIEAYSGGNDGWHLLASPVATFSIDGSAFDPGANDDLYRWEESTGWWMNHKAGDPTQIVPGTGYLVAYESTATKSFSGTLNNADISKSDLTYTIEMDNTGWHLLGNPFSCALQWNPSSGNAWSLSNVAGTAKIWNEGNASYSDISQDGYIPATQGFMVMVSSATNSLTIPTANRVHNATSWYKDGDTNKIKLTAFDPQGKTAQETVIRFDSRATAQLDLEYDSYFLSGYAPMFYSVAEGKALSTNAQPELTEELTIPLWFIKNGSEAFYIEAEGLENLEPSYPVYLTDLLTGTEHELTANPVYSFTSADGDETARFILHFRPVGMDEKNIPHSNVQVWSSAQTLYILNPDHATGQVRIVTMYGQELLTTELTGRNEQQIVTTLTSGCYVAAITANGQPFSRKIIIH